MNQQRGPAGPDNDAEPKILGVEDIPGAVAPDAAGPADGGGNAGLNERLAAFRARRAAQGGAGGAGGQGGGPGGGAGANAGRRRQGMGRGQGQGQGMGMGGGGG